MRLFLNTLLVLASLPRISLALPQSVVAYNPDTNVEGNARNQNAQNAAATQQSPVPSSVSKANTSPSILASTPDDNVEVKARYENSLKCTIFDPPDSKTSLAQCQNVCGEAVAKRFAAGETSSVTCYSFTKGDPQWQHFGGNTRAAGATCTCNEPLLEDLAKTFTDAVTAIAEVGCTILMTALNLVVEVGALAIPGVGEAIDGGLIAGISAAKLAAYSYDAGNAGLNAFAGIVNPCGKTGKVPDDLKKAFDILNAANPAVIPKGGFKIPKGLPKGGGLPKGNGPDAPKPDTPKPDTPKQEKPVHPKENQGKKTNDTPQKTDSPKTDQAPKSTDPPKTNDASKTTGSPHCSLRKRAGDGQKGCDHVTSTTITKSEAMTTQTITKKCNGKRHPQACYHYWSAIHMRKESSMFTCSDENVRWDGVATKYWSSQHRHDGWFKPYTQPAYDFLDAKGIRKHHDDGPRCEADEWPPGYFMPRDVKEKEIGQMIRWLPKYENGGAAQLWKKFCSDNDGGKGNGQLRSKDEKDGKWKEGDVNTELVKLKPHPKVDVVSPGGTTTTISSFEAEYTRAIFVLDFDNRWENGPPNRDNDWGLRDNPCWPQAIVPDDPGFVLLTNDKWYDETAKKPSPDRREQYKEPPEPKVTENAAAWQKQNLNNKRPGPTKDDDDKTDSSLSEDSDGGNNKRSLEVIKDGFPIQNFNITRRLSDEEEQEVEIISCADRTCSKERESIGYQERVVFIDGQETTSIGPRDIAAVATLIPKAATTMEVRLHEKRKAASAELPVATAPAS